MIQESGRSMIEMLGVLAIMGVITVGAIGMIASAMRMQKQSTVNDDVVMMVTSVRQLLGEYDDFSNIDNATIFTAIGMKNQNPYGGNYALSVNPVNTRQFVVSIDGLSRADCKTLTTKAWTDSISGAQGECDKDTNNAVSIIYGE
ncbi:MAG: type II secretion system protein [Alphaproteobacteria bacterium]